MIPRNRVPASAAMLHRIFAAHPQAVSETYREHQAAAFFFAGALLKAGLAAAIHGLIPCLFTSSASRAVERLHRRMSLRNGLD